jgi:hypothetical protein
MQHAAQAQTASAVPAGPAQGTVPVEAQIAAVLELQASLGFLADQAAAGVRQLYDYVERNAPTHPELDDCLTPAIEATRAFEASDFGRSLAQVLQVYRQVAQARAANPALPPLPGLARVAGLG